MTQTIRATSVVDADGHLNLPPLIHAIGRKVDVIILLEDEARTAPQYSLRGLSYRFDDPFSAPIADDEWEANL